VLLAHIDESRSGDQRIFTVGGWLATEGDWKSIENEWRQRVEHEQRISRKKGFPVPFRYHASDCSNLRGEFDTSKGWDKDRQKLFIKKLVGILAKKRKEPVLGFSFSVVMDNWEIAFKNRRWAERNAYHHMFFEAGSVIGEAMSNRWPNERVTVFHDFGPFNESAQAAYRKMCLESFPYRDFFVTVAPRKWEDCLALQAADLIAYEGQKSAHLGLSISDNATLQRSYRKSLQKLLHGKTNLHGLCFTNFFNNLIEQRRTSNTYPIKTAAIAP
jgi:hypothetical protein